MADIVERLREHRTMSQFQHVSDLIARLNNERDDAADEIERLRDALRDVVDWAEDLQIYAEPEHHMHPVFYKARDALGEKE